MLEKISVHLSQSAPVASQITVVLPPWISPIKLLARSPRGAAIISPSLKGPSPRELFPVRREREPGTTRSNVPLERRVAVEGGGVFGFGDRSTVVSEARGWLLGDITIVSNGCHRRNRNCWIYYWMLLSLDGNVSRCGGGKEMVEG